MKKENTELVKQAIINEYEVSDELATLAAKVVGKSLIALANRFMKPKEDKDEYVDHTTGDNFEFGEYVIYVDGDRFEIGRIKSLREDGAFVCYHEGETAAKTPYGCMHKLINRHCIKETTLGGEVFNETD